MLLRRNTWVQLNFDILKILFFMSWQNPFDLGKNCIHHDQWGSEQTRCKFYHNKQPFRILSYLNRRQLKSSRYSFVMRRDTHSKSSSIHLLSPKHCQIISLSSDQGNAYVTMRYIDEKAFRLQTKHILKKLTAVTKRLRDLKEGATPYMKLTYYEGLTHSVFFFFLIWEQIFKEMGPSHLSSEILSVLYFPTNII